MKTPVLTAAASLIACLSWAQQADPVFTREPWNLQVRAPRIMGLGGIFVTTAEGSAALPLNPAAAYEVSRDASLSFRGRAGAGYVQSKGRCFGNVSCALGLRIEHAFSREFEGAASRLTDPTPTRAIDSGRVTFEGYDLTFGGATHWRRRLFAINVGASGTLGVLRGAGTYASVDVDRRIDRRYGYSGSAPRLGGAAGLLAELGHEFTALRLRAGLAGQWSRASELKRETLELIPNADPIVGLEDGFKLRHPDAWSLGADLRLPAPRLGNLTLAGQVDLVDYADVERVIPPVAEGAPPFGFTPGSDRDYSLAAELALTSIRVLEKLRLRVGTRWVSERTLKQNPALVAKPDRRRPWFFGLSLDLDVVKPLRIDVDVRERLEEIAMGLGVRF